MFAMYLTTFILTFKYSWIHYCIGQEKSLPNCQILFAKHFAIQLCTIISIVMFSPTLFCQIDFLHVCQTFLLPNFRPIHYTSMRLEASHKIRKIYTLSKYPIL